MRTGRIFFFLLILLSAQSSVGQVSRMQQVKIGIVAPLYLDSAFNGKAYRYNQNSFPRFTVAGLDFVQGALIALDSLAGLEINAEVKILDAKSAKEPLSEMLSSGKLDDLDMIIGSVKEPEIVMLADHCKKKAIPFISATFPNDAGIRDNAFTVITNPTLLSHCESLFAYLLQNHGMEKILLVRKKGVQEDKVESYFQKANTREGKPFLKIETIKIDSSFTLLKTKLDSTRTNVIICGSLDEEFANGLSGFLFSNMKKYPVKLIGMPNWNDFSMVKKAKYKDLAFYYSSGHINNRTDTMSKCMQKAYLKKFKGLPSDFAFKGYETTFYFGTLLSAHGSNIFPYLNEPELPNLPEYQFRPAMRAAQEGGPDYYENKHLMIMKSVNGDSQKAW